MITINHYFEEINCETEQQINGGLVTGVEILIGLVGIAIFESLNEYVTRKTGSGIGSHTLDAIEDAADAWNGYSESHFLYQLTH